MTNQNQILTRIVAAAKALLEARQDQMVTSDEWDHLAEATQDADPTWSLEDDQNED